MVYLHTRFVNKPQKIAGVSGVPEQWDESTAKWRVHCDWKVSDQVQLRGRFEYVGYQFNESKEDGYLALSGSDLYSFIEIEVLVKNGLLPYRGI